MPEMPKQNMRESALLPFAKCSICNANVQLSLMADHICGSKKSESKTSRFQRPFGLPRIDSSVANSPFQLTPPSSPMNGRGISSRSNDPMAGFDCSFTTFETPELLSPTTGLDSPIIPLSPPPPPITPSGHSGHGGYRFFFSRSATAPQASIAKKSQNSAPQATSPPKPARVPPHPGIIGLPLAPSQFRKSNAPKALPSEPAHAASPAEESSTSFSTMATPPVQRPAPLRIETTDSPKPNVTQQQHAQTFSMSSSTRTSSRSYVPKSYGMSSPPPSGISTAFSTSSDPRFVDPKTLHYGPHRRAVVVSGDSSAKEMDSLLSYLNSSMPPAPADAGDHHLPQQQPPPPQNNIYTSPTVPLPLLPKKSSQDALNRLELHTTKPAHPEAPTPHTPRTPTATTSKGPCRGCGEQIHGKSISSADGRLTGRYHKQCFTCKTCNQPFQSAEFYVIDDMPLCHRHYHVQNHSLCIVCDTGIEGSCVETSARRRFHPSCFTCSQCHCELGDDYFEINGRPVCEPHAHRHMKQQQQQQQQWQQQNHPSSRGGGGGALAPPPQPNVQRRRSRLIFVPGIEVPHISGLGSGSRYPEPI